MWGELTIIVFPMCATSAGTLDCSSYRNYCMRRIASSDGHEDTLCHIWDIHRSSESDVVRGASVHGVRSPRGAGGEARLPDNQSRPLHRQQLNRSHDVDGGAAFHA